MKTKELLITADDYGVHDTIDRGIEDSRHNLDCIDIIVTHDSAKNRVDHLLRVAKKELETNQLKLGLHLTLNVGKPQYRDMESKQGRSYLRTIAKRSGLYEGAGSEFKHQSARGILCHMNAFVKYHSEALKEEIRRQYCRFIELVGSKPIHVSSHNGVFNGHPDIYELLKEVCLELDLPIRCPALIAYDHHPGLNEWRNNQQQLLTEKQFKKMSLIRPEGPIVKKWMKSGQRARFDLDMSKQKVKSTGFFITHFYLQGCMQNFKAILNRLVNTPEQIEDSYELVAHPVYFDKDLGYDDMPRGIKTNKFPERLVERNTLAIPNLRKIIDNTQSEKFKIVKYQFATTKKVICDGINDGKIKFSIQG